MQLLLLHLDDALELQPGFVRACVAAGASQHVDKYAGRDVRLWSKQRQLSELARSLSKNGCALNGQPRLCFMGSGDFHHITALLLDAALEKHPTATTLIHFDNHPDWVKFKGGLHCGSWVNSALENRNIDKVITIGVCSDDLRNPERKGANLKWLAQGRLELYPYSHPPSRVSLDYGSGPSFRQEAGALHWRSICGIGEANFFEEILGRIQTPSVYISIDKDVLAADDAVTNWDQGGMRLPYLLSLISEIGRRHRVIGADVIGDYSAPAYSGMPWTQIAKRVESLIDQPRLRQDKSAIEDVNSAANYALLDILAEHMQ